MTYTSYIIKSWPANALKDTFVIGNVFNLRLLSFNVFHF